MTKSFPSYLAGVAGEEDATLVGQNVLQVLLGLGQRHTTQSGGGLTGVLEVNTQVAAGSLHLYGGGSIFRGGIF